MKIVKESINDIFKPKSEEDVLRSLGIDINKYYTNDNRIYEFERFSGNDMMVMCTTNKKLMRSIYFQCTDFFKLFDSLENTLTNMLNHMLPIAPWWQERKSLEDIGRTYQECNDYVQNNIELIYQLAKEVKSCSELVKILYDNQNN